MKFALFYGCQIPARLTQFADATKAVCHRLGVELVEVKAFNCCGHPARNMDRRAFILSAAQNLAVAEQAGLDMLVMCKCCYGSLKKAAYLLNRDPDLKADINGILAKEGLEYKNTIQVKHLLSVLYHDVGLERIKENLSTAYGNLPIAVSYGCHALRPSAVTKFDDPVTPVIFDELVEATGAVSLEWARKLDCCGAPLTGINDRIALDMAHKKIDNAREAGARFICIACPYSQLQFDDIQTLTTAGVENRRPVPPILYPQLLGLCMGIDERTLGLRKNKTDLSGITSFLKAE